MKKIVPALIAAALSASSASAALLHFDVSYKSGTTDSFNVDTTTVGTPSASSAGFFGNVRDYNFAIQNDSLGFGVLQLGDAGDGFYFATGNTDNSAFFSASTFGNTASQLFDSATRLITATPGYVFNDGSLKVTVTSAESAVPEPASWAMMVGGFGLAGGAIRRKKATVSFA